MTAVVNRARALALIAAESAADLRLIQPVLDTAFTFRLLERAVSAGDIAVKVAA